MAQGTTHEPGSFCWFELAATDAAEAKKFYTDLFDWRSEDFQVGPGPGDLYTIFHVGDKQVAALYQLSNEQRAKGVPANWLSYVAVKSADDKAAQANSLGATQITAPFDVMDKGRMAVIQDPAGAVFALWQANSEQGVSLKDANGAACWNDLMTTDGEGSKAFYSKLFGWTTAPSGPTGTEYTELINQGKHFGGMMEMKGDEWKGIPSHWVTYYMVASTDAIASKAQSLGARLLVPPHDIPSVGRFSMIMDGQGAVFSVFTPLPHPAK